MKDTKYFLFLFGLHIIKNLALGLGGSAPQILRRDALGCGLPAGEVSPGSSAPRAARPRGAARRKAPAAVRGGGLPSARGVPEAIGDLCGALQEILADMCLPRLRLLLFLLMLLRLSGDVRLHFACEGLVRRCITVAKTSLRCGRHSQQLRIFRDL